MINSGSGEIINGDVLKYTENQTVIELKQTAQAAVVASQEDVKVSTETNQNGLVRRYGSSQGESHAADSDQVTVNQI